MRAWPWVLSIAAGGCSAVYSVGLEPSDDAPRSVLGSADGAIAYYSFDDGGAGSACVQDDAPGHHHPGYCPSYIGHPTLVAGRTGGSAAHFNGNNGFLVPCDGDLTQPSTLYSATTWMLLDTPLTDSCPVNRPDGSDQGDAWEFCVDPPGMLNVYNDGSPGEGFSTALDDQWHHIALTWDGSAELAYVDGAVVGTVYPTAVASTATDMLAIGIDIDGTFDGGPPTMPNAGLHGALDDVRIYDITLTPQQVADQAVP